MQIDSCRDDCCNADAGCWVREGQGSSKGWVVFYIHIWFDLISLKKTNHQCEGGWMLWASWGTATPAVFANGQHITSSAKALSLSLPVTDWESRSDYQRKRGAFVQTMLLVGGHGQRQPEREGGFCNPSSQVKRAARERESGVPAAGIIAQRQRAQPRRRGPSPLLGVFCLRR
jgi:hypothetical protein